MLTPPPLDVAVRQLREDFEASRARLRAARWEELRDQCAELQRAVSEVEPKPRRERAVSEAEPKPRREPALLAMSSTSLSPSSSSTAMQKPPRFTLHDFSGTWSSDCGAMTISMGQVRDASGEAAPLVLLATGQLELRFAGEVWRTSYLDANRIVWEGDGGTWIRMAPDIRENSPSALRPGSQHYSHGDQHHLHAAREHPHHHFAYHGGRDQHHGDAVHQSGLHHNHRDHYLHNSPHLNGTRDHVIHHHARSGRSPSPAKNHQHMVGTGTRVVVHHPHERSVSGSPPRLAQQRPTEDQTYNAYQVSDDAARLMGPLAAMVQSHQRYPAMTPPSPHGLWAPSPTPSSQPGDVLPPAPVFPGLQGLPRPPLRPPSMPMLQGSPAPNSAATVWPPSVMTPGMPAAGTPLPATSAFMSPALAFGIQPPSPLAPSPIAPSTQMFNTNSPLHVAELQAKVEQLSRTVANLQGELSCMRSTAKQNGQSTMSQPREALQEPSLLTAPVHSPSIYTL